MGHSPLFTDASWLASHVLSLFVEGPPRREAYCSVGIKAEVQLRLWPNGPLAISFRRNNQEWFLRVGQGPYERRLDHAQTWRIAARQELARARTASLVEAGKPLPFLARHAELLVDAETSVQEFTFQILAAFSQWGMGELWTDDLRELERYIAKLVGI